MTRERGLALARRAFLPKHRTKMAEGHVYLVSERPVDMTEDRELVEETGASSDAVPVYRFHMKHGRLYCDGVRL